MVESSRQFSLRHIKHETKLNNSLYAMLLDQSLVDVILSCDGTNIRAHRLILSANSSYFKSLFDSLESNRCQIPIIILKDVPLVDLKAIVEFMYRGEVCVEEKQLSSVLKSAELLKVFGLTEVCLALRSRLSNESVSDKSGSVSGPTPHKRPRINDGLNPTAQQSNEFFSNLSNARFEIRPNHSAINSSNQPQVRTIVSTAIASNAPTVVKNVILPSSQIYKKSDSMVQMVPKVTTTPLIQPIISCNSLQNTSYSFGQKSTSIAKQSAIVETIGPNRGSSATWTPSQTPSQTPCQQPLPLGLAHLSSSSQTLSKTPIEVIIDDSTHDSITCNEENNEEMDIKPPIFELEERLELENEVIISDVESESNQRDSEIKINKTKAKPIETSKTEMRCSTRSPIKSRTPSTSSQSSLPPPPSYKVVQRSSSRLLRNIIKPTASMASSSASKSKESDDNSKSIPKRERQSVRLIRHKIPKSEKDLNSGNVYGESIPEIECPSCGQMFNDERKWNEHIATVHLPSSHT